MKRRALLGVVVLSLMGVLIAGLLAPVRDVHAQTPEPTPRPSPTTPSPAPQNIFHILSFPFETMIEAIIKMSGGIVQAFYSEAEGLFAGALDPVMSNPYGIAPASLGDGLATPLFRDLIAPGWEVSFGLALALLPATLALTAAAALRQGATSVLGYTELKEALIGWLFAAGAAALSLYALGLAHRLSLSAAGAVLAADFGERVSGAALARAFFNAPALALIAGLFPPAALYVGFFILFLGSTLLLALCLGLAAYTALAYLLSVIAPVVLVLSTLPPLRWLQALWLKATVIVFLIPLADAFLLKVGASLYRGFFDPDQGGSLAGFVASLFILGGALSVLITLNVKVAEGVFSALADVHRQAWGATAGVVQLVLSATALAGGAITGGTIAGGMATATTMDGRQGPTGSGAPMGDGVGGDPTSGHSSSRAAPDTPGSRLLDIAQRLQGLGRRMTPGSGGTQDRAGTRDETAHTSAGASKIDPATRANTATVVTDDIADAQSTLAEPQESRAVPVSSDLNAPQTGSSRPVGNATTHGPEGELPSSLNQESLPPSFSASTGLESDAILQRARLAERFGQLLAVATRHPAARAFGAGMQAAGAWAAHRARTAWDESPPLDALPPTTPLNRSSALTRTESEMGTPSEPPTHSLPDTGNTESFLPESSRGMDLAREDYAEVVEALNDSFGQAGRGVDTSQLAAVVETTFGQAPISPDPAAPPTEAQREFFTLALDPANKQSPGHLLGALNAWAERHGIALSDDVAARVMSLFAGSRERRNEDE